MIHPISATNYNAINRNASRRKTSRVVRFPIALGFGSLRGKRARVLPFPMNRTSPLADRDPAALAGRYAGALVRLLEPRNNAGRFRPVTSSCLVVVWESAVKRILSRRELYRNVIAAMRGIWIVESAVISAPIFVP